MIPTAILSALREQARAAVGQMVLALLAGLAGLAGAVFLLVAAYLSLARVVGRPEAAGMIGVGLVLAALVIVLVLRSRQGLRRHTPTPRSALQGAAPLKSDALPVPADPALFAVFVVGFVLARRYLRRD